MFTFGNDIVNEIDLLMKKGSHETFKMFLVALDQE